MAVPTQMIQGALVLAAMLLDALKQSIRAKYLQREEAARPYDGGGAFPSRRRAALHRPPQRRPPR
jgi:hypothetical protein